jgi:hypothetical protein
MFNAFSSDADIVAELGMEMEIAENDHRALMALVSAQIAVEQCFHEAEMHKIGIDTAAMRIQRAAIDTKLQLGRFADLVRSLSRTIVEGQAAVAREQGREVPQISFHYWLDERVDRFARDFAWAKQLTYLALRAVEYEYQQSLAITDDVLRATHPDQLLDAIHVMQQEQLTRTINSRRPEDSIIVLSLRDEIMRVEDRGGVPEGERDWPPQTRFQHRLWSPEYAVYDDGGEYLGQGIPFTLDERGALELRCAERLWRVTATIQGDLLDETAPHAPVFLIQENSFASQWCDGRGDDTPYQVGSMPPTSRLFPPGDRGGSEAAGIHHVTAMMQPWFNVRRSDFYREGYEEGASEELAGRGLYGDYILLFPWHGLLDHEFPLEQVEDVLIRFDYLSVDDISL